MTNQQFAIIKRWYQRPLHLDNVAFVNKLCIFAEVEIDDYKAQLQSLDYVNFRLAELNHILDKLQEVKMVLKILHSIQ